MAAGEKSVSHWSGLRALRVILKDDRKNSKIVSVFEGLNPASPQFQAQRPMNFEKNWFHT
jgi:hypothetical protein